MMQPFETFSFEAIGTHWWVESLDGEPLAHASKQKLVERAEEFDRLYSRFRTDSLITQLNQTGRLADPSPEMLAMLRFCEEMFEVSDGAFNVSVGGTLHRLGYGKREQTGRLYDEPWQHIIYNECEVLIPDDMTLDTGGYGKGWLIDDFNQLLKAQGKSHFLINGGGDMYIDSSAPVEIALEHPRDDTKSVGLTRITKGALAVSGTQKRHWEHAGKRYHHIIDPKTADSLRTNVAGVYVRADTALVADTMATILMIRPELEKKLSRLYNLKVVVLLESQLG